MNWGHYAKLNKPDKDKILHGITLYVESKKKKLKFKFSMVVARGQGVGECRG